uniref:Enhancer of rudimentary homolog n=1 Tax=Oryza meridionalis TaxID=40149 RepID=A0A0E0CGW7_9ORYZ
MAGRHTIILMQPSQNRATRTFMDFNSVSHALDGICGLYERKIRDINPMARDLTYDINDLYNFIDGLTDISALVFDRSLHAFLPYDRRWIKQEMFQHLKRWDRGGGGGCNPLTGEEEVRAAAVAGDGDDVGEQAPDGLDDPGGADEPLVELRRRRLHALHVLPVVPRGDAADGVADALAGPVDGHDGEHEAPVQLAGQTPEPAAGEGGAAAFAAAAGFLKRRVVVLLLSAIHLGSDLISCRGFLGIYGGIPPEFARLECRSRDCSVGEIDEAHLGVGELSKSKCALMGIRAQGFDLAPPPCNYYSTVY